LANRRIYQDAPLAQSKGSEPKLRLHLLDSIRGWASINVLVFHVSHEMFVNKIPELGSYWVTFFLNGGFAVAVFFVLSGEALSHGFFVKNDINLVRKLAIKRYVRLTIPIFVSCLSVYLLMKSNLVFSRQAAVILDRGDWLGLFLPFEPSISKFFSYSLYGVYFSHTTANSYNPFLWTMSMELFGSLIVFFILFVTRNRFQRWAVFALMTPFIIAFSPFLICFLFGMIFGEMRVAGTFKRFAAHSAANWMSATLAIGVGVLLIIYPLLGPPSAGVAHRLSFGAAIFLFAIYSSNWLQGLLDNRFSRFLGELSFPIYLVHFPMIVSLESYLVVSLCPDGIVNRGWAYVIILVTLLACLLAAMAFVYVERFAIKASNSFFGLIDGL
jgi:peptidoglycan/LPS O-acetylase OafA/YrhL